MIDHPPQSGNFTLRPALESYLELTQRRHVERGRITAAQNQWRKAGPVSTAWLIQEDLELQVFEEKYVIPADVARDVLIAAVLVEHGLNPRADVFPPVASLVAGRLVVVGRGDRSQSVELFVLNFDDVHGARQTPAPPPAQPCNGRHLLLADQAVS